MITVRACVHSLALLDPGTTPETGREDVSWSMLGARATPSPGDGVSSSYVIHDHSDDKALGIQGSQAEK